MNTNHTSNDIGVTVFVNRPKPFPTGEIRTTEWASMIYVEKGFARIEIDFREHLLKANQLLLLAPKNHVLFTEESDDFTVSCVSFSPTVSEDITGRFEPTFFGFLTEYPVAEIEEKDAVYVHHLIAGVNHILENSTGEHRLQMAKNMIQCFYLEHYDRNKERIARRQRTVVSSQEYLFMKFLSLVHQYAGCERDLAFYADKLCISTRYLSTVVHNQTGETAKRIIDNRSVQEIKIQLRTTADSLQSIAARLNFPDQSFFSRYFKKNTGVTPKEYRAIQP